MKFCVIRDSNTGKYLAQYFEEYYEYSEYTSGGGTFDTTTCSLEDTLGESDCKLVIFENEKKAKEYLDYHYPKQFYMEIVNLMDIKC